MTHQDRTDADRFEPDLEETLSVMSLADRRRHHDEMIDRATSLDHQREALRRRLDQLYSDRGIPMDSHTLDSAIEQHLSQRLTHREVGGWRARLARFYVRCFMRRRHLPSGRGDQG